MPFNCEQDRVQFIPPCARDSHGGPCSAAAVAGPAAADSLQPRQPAQGGAAEATPERRRPVRGGEWTLVGHGAPSTACRTHRRVHTLYACLLTLAVPWCAVQQALLSACTAASWC